MGMKLNLAEMVFLLLLDHRKGTFDLLAWQNLPACLAQAVLADLALSGYLRTNTNQELIAREHKTACDSLKQDVFNLIKQSGTAKTSLTWVRILQSENQHLVERVAASLADREVLKETAERYLGIFPFKAFRVIEPDESHWIGMEVRAVALACEPPNPASAFLLELLTARGLLRTIFEGYEINLAIQTSNHLRWDRLVSPMIGCTFQTILSTLPSRWQVIT
jgi:hypothetical protein